MELTACQIVEGARAAINDKLDAFGFLFDDQSQSFRNNSKLIKQSLFIAPTKSKTSVYFNFDFYLSIWFPRLDAFLAPYHNPPSGFPICCFMKNICPKNSLYSWYIFKYGDVLELADEFRSKLNDLALPFFDKYSSLDSFATCIEEDVGRKIMDIPIAVTAEKGEILLAIYILRGEIDRFKQMVPVMRKEVSRENRGYYVATFDRIVKEMAKDHGIVL